MRHIIFRISLLVLAALISLTVQSQDFDFTVSASQGCSPLQVVFTNTTPSNIINDYRYEWFVGGDNFSVLQTNVQNSYVNPGVYSPVLKVYDKITNALVKTITKTDFITVFNDPSVTIKADKQINCIGSNVQFSVDTVISDAPITSWKWILSDGNSYTGENIPPHQFAQPIDYVAFVTVTDGNGCINRLRSQITVSIKDDAPVDLVVSSSDYQACAATLPIDFVANTTDPDVTYKWDFGDGSSSEEKSPTHTYNGYGNYYAIVRAEKPSGCSAIGYQYVQLIDYNANIGMQDSYKTFGDGGIACNGPVTFYDASAPSNPPTLTYSWDFMNDGSIDGVQNSFQANVDPEQPYSIKFVMSNGICKDSIVKSFTVEKELIADFGPKDLFFCEPPQTVDFTGVSNIPGTTFDWGIHGSGTTKSITYNGTGFFGTSVTAISPNKCREYVSKPDNVEIPYRLATIRPKSTLSGCLPLDIEFVANITYQTTNDNVATISWDMDGNGTEDAVGVSPQLHTFPTRGVYPSIVTVTTDRGCVFTGNSLPPDSVKVGDIPKADFLFSDTIPCSRDTVFATFVPSDPTLLRSMNDTLFYLNFNPLEPNKYPIPSISQLVPPKDFDKVLRDSIGYHEVVYELSDHGCRAEFVDSTILTNGDTIKTLINVKGPIIEGQQSAFSCVTPYLRDWNLNKIINVDTLDTANQYYEWYLSKTSSISGAPVFFKKKIAHNVKEISIDFENDTLGRGAYTINVYAFNKSELCLQPDQKCNCVDSLEFKTLIVEVKADFTLVDSTPCLNDTAAYVFGPLAQDVKEVYWNYDYGTTRQWNANDPLNNPYIFDKEEINRVTIVAQDANYCYQSVSLPVKVYNPKPNFSGDILTDCIDPDFTTTFTDATLSDTTIVERRWTFGNGTSDLGNNTVVTSTYSSNYSSNVTLEVTDIIGCKNKTVKLAYIKPFIPSTFIKVIQDSICLNHDADFIRVKNNSLAEQNLSRFMWDFGDGQKDSVSTADTVPHLYTIESSPSYFTVKFTGYAVSPEGNECMAESKIQVFIKDVNARIDTVGMDRCKEPGQKFIVDLAAPNADFLTLNWWKMENNNRIDIGYNKNLDIVFFDEYGMQRLYLETTSRFYGCETDTTYLPVDVAGYLADFDVDKKLVCVGQEIQFSLKDTVNVYRYPHWWNFGDGNQAQVSDGYTTHEYTNLPNNVDNTYPVSFVVDAPGCIPKNKVISIKLYPVISEFDRGIDDIDTIGCAPYTVSFINNSVGADGAEYIWDFGDGTTSSEKNPSHTFDNVDTKYPVSLSFNTSICPAHIEKPITTHPLSTIDYTLDSTVCVGDSTLLSASGNFVSLHWTPEKYFADATNPVTYVTPTKTMYAIANLVSPNGCESIDSAYIFVQQYPQYYGAPDSSLQYYFSSDSLKLVSLVTSKIIAGQLYNVNNDNIPGIIYNWVPSSYLSCDDCASPDINLQCGTPGYPNCLDFPETVQYTISMADTLGCFENERSITFEIILETKAALPQAFSPNNDGDNDIAFVRGWGIKKLVEVVIYNRWGQAVFTTTDLQVGWDGTFNGKAQNADTYAYTIKIINTQDQEEFIKGYITLIR